MHWLELNDAIDAAFTTEQKHGCTIWQWDFRPKTGNPDHFMRHAEDAGDTRGAAEARLHCIHAPEREKIASWLEGRA